MILFASGFNTLVVPSDIVTHESDGSITIDESDFIPGNPSSISRTFTGLADRRVIITCDFLADDDPATELPVIYLKLYNQFDERLDSGSAGRWARPSVRGDWCRTTLSIDLAGNVDKVDINVGQFSADVSTGIHKARNFSIYVETVSQMNPTTPAPLFLMNGTEASGMQQLGGGVALRWVQTTLDLSATFNNVGTNYDFTTVLSGGWSVYDEAGIGSDAEYMGSIFVRLRESGADAWTLFNGNPKASSQEIPVKLWALGIL